MIDYDKTVEKFFESVKSYLSAATLKARDKDELNAIQINMRKVERVAAQPQIYASYASRLQDGLVIRPEGFMKSLSSADNRVFLAFKQVLTELEKLYQRRESMAGCGLYLQKEKANLLAAIKAWNYRTSTSKFKDFTFPFKSPESFAVHVKQNQK